MIFPDDFEHKIGFDAIRSRISDLCKSRLGKEEAISMSFSTDIDDIRNRLDSVSEMMRIITGALPYPSVPAHDVIPYIAEIRSADSFMAPDRLYKLMQMLLSFAEVDSFFRSRSGEDGKPMFPALSFHAASLSLFPEVTSAISKAIDKYGEIKDNASPELYEIRQQVRRAEGGMQRAVRRVLDSAIASGIVDKDTSPSIRDGRMVIPVAAGNKRSISGIVHDESATGKTVFIEPAEVVEAGNRLRQLQMDERREEIAVLRRVADVIRPVADAILDSCRVMGRFDFIEAKSAFAIETDARMPHINPDVELEWYHAVHPGLLLSLRAHGRETVPLDIILTSEKRILIVSGPNAGGKSVTLKTVAIVQYMMQCGMMPTLYENSHMGIFRDVMIDIGDEQSIENDLSTYSSHLCNMRVFVTRASKRSLFLADEMGSGTEPQIGGAMAQAILDRLGRSGAYGVVTTHYQNLKTFADNTPGFVNGAMLYDRQRLSPLFQLSIGNPGSSFALDIAHKMGLPLDVIDEAKRIAGEDYVNLDKYLSDITRDRKYWSNKRQNIREKEAKLDQLLSRYEEVAGDLRSQRRRILDDARREAKEILGTANSQIERTILEIRKTQAEKERTKELRKNLQTFADSVTQSDSEGDKNLPRELKPLKHKSRARKQTPSPVQTAPVKKEITVGDFVKMKDASTAGQVISISGKKAEVAFGALRTFVDVARLEHTRSPRRSELDAAPGLSSSTSEDSRRRQLNFNNQIDVRGMRADEAIQAVTYFLDDAIQFSASRVRILHGTGQGILKTMIRQQLKINPAVKSFADEDIRFGGAGITVVELE